MVATPVYMDNHATTRVDPRVLEAMWPYFGEKYGNAASSSHGFGWEAKDAVDAARETIAAGIGAAGRELVFTSGATESDNLALWGVCERTRLKGRHLISVTTEHPAVLDPLAQLERRGFQVTLLPVCPQGQAAAGVVDVEQLESAIREDTVLVSVMLANNEIGVLQPVAEIGRICKARGILFHTDATQAVGKWPVAVDDLQVDLLSLSAHKMYGPKGVGALYVRRRDPIVRLERQIDGGRHEFGLRSGTLNVPGIVGFARAITLAQQELPAEMLRLRHLRERLWTGLQAAVSGVALNGPALDRPELRLPGNLNCSLEGVEGEALMLGMRELAVSSGSACSSGSPEPSHVLRSLGLSDERARSSLRFGLGRFNTEEEVEFAIGLVAATVDRLRKLGGGPPAAL